MSKKIEDKLFDLAKEKVALRGVELSKEMMVSDAGIDSLDLIELSFEIEEIFDVDIDPKSIQFEDQTIAELLKNLGILIEQMQSAAQAS